MSGRTPGPWSVGEYETYLGYDCMTGGVRAGPVVLDGRDYGQQSCEEISPDQLARMMANARLIAAAPDLLEALQYLMASPAMDSGIFDTDFADAAIAKATGAQP